MREIFLINISGVDRPGLTARLTGVLSGFEAEVLDIGQAVIHNRLALGLLVASPEGRASGESLQQAFQTVADLNLQIEVEPIRPASYQDWVSRQGRQRHILTLLGRKLSARQISEVASKIAAHGLNIDEISRLSGRMPLNAAEDCCRACVEFSLSGPVRDELALRRELLELCEQSGVDVSVQADNLYRRSRRLVVFDMDSTLIQAEVIDELAKAAGSGEQVAAITAAAMRGELDFRQSLRRRVRTLEGLDEAALERIGEQLPLTEGVERLIGTLKRLGYRTGIISGGFDYFGERLRRRLGFDYVFANRLGIARGRLTGGVLGEIIDGPRKAEILRELAHKEGISLEQTIAVGDGANDLPMLAAAGLGVAFHPKPIVAREAKRAISNFGLDGLLYLIGIRDRDVDEPL